MRLSLLQARQWQHVRGASPGADTPQTHTAPVTPTFKTDTRRASSALPCRCALFAKYQFGGGLNTLQAPSPSKDGRWACGGGASRGIRAATALPRRPRGRPARRCAAAGTSRAAAWPPRSWRSAPPPGTRPRRSASTAGLRRSTEQTTQRTSRDGSLHLCARTYALHERRNDSLLCGRESGNRQQPLLSCLLRIRCCNTLNRRWGDGLLACAA